MVCLDGDGKPRFYDLMFARGEPRFVVFDMLAVDGRDLRAGSLVERKQSLRHLIPLRSSRVLYADHVDGKGVDLFRTVCDGDLEGIVAKWKPGPYRPDLSPSSWVKIKNRDYSRARDRHELFEPRG